jgi:hypothetical protein
MSEIYPNNNDAILGGQNPPPVDAAVLGGEIGRKQRLQHEKAIARQNKFWRNFPYLDGLPNCHASIFADRQVVNFEPGLEIIDPKETAYALRENHYRYRGLNENLDFTFQEKWQALIDCTRISEVEALIFGNGPCYLDYVNSLVGNYSIFNSLKAIFFGDIEDRESMISDLSFGCDISPVLSVYPDLEILHIRSGGRGNHLSFSEWRHEKLKALRIESSGLNRSAITSLCQLELPALEYLELWTEYGSNSSIEDVIPIISGERFPKLKYLGIKNCEYTNDVVDELIKSPLMESLLELDLSMGTLNMEGFLKLANSTNINNLAYLNIDGNCLPINWLSPSRYETITSLHPEILNIKCKLTASNQRPCSDRSTRYCSVRE